MVLKILQVTQKCNCLEDISESIVNFALKFVAFSLILLFFGEMALSVIPQKPFIQSDWKDFICKALWFFCPF